MEWINIFFSVNDYWMYKYRNTTVPENSNNTYLTPLQLSWNSYLSISSMIPNVSFLFINAFLGKDAIKKDKTLIEVFCKSKTNRDKVHIFWEGHKFLRNLHRRFVLCSNGQIYGGDFPKNVAFSEYMNLSLLVLD